MLFNKSLPGGLQIFYRSTPLILNSCSSDSKSNLRRYTTPYSTPPILLVTFGSSLTNISPFHHICQLRCIRPYLQSIIACSIATPIVHSKLDYCNSLYYSFPKSQIIRLQQVQNSLARAGAVVKVIPLLPYAVLTITQPTPA